MAIELMLITNEPQHAKIAEDSGVDWIFVDLEVNGKSERQANNNMVLSAHSIEDITNIKSVITKAKLLVRVNPIFSGSKNEINNVIDAGADMVMLPYFQTKCEAETFIGHVNGRAKTCLLIETKSAVDHIDEILSLHGIDALFVGLNDLCMSYHMRFAFEPLAAGLVDILCRKFQSTGIPYGFGGIARLGHGELPADYVLGEHYRLGSSMAILSRSFFNAEKPDDLRHAQEIFLNGIAEIRSYGKTLEQKEKAFFDNNRRELCDKVMELIDNGYRT